MSSIIAVNISGKILLIHAGMVTGDDHRGVIIEFLLLKPADKLQHLSGGARQHILILFLMMGWTIFAGVAVNMVGIYGQQGEGKGLFPCRELLQLLFGIGKELCILEAPPDHIVRGDEPVFSGCIQIIDMIRTVLFIILSAPAEGGIGADHKGLIVTLLTENILQGRCTRQVTLELCQIYTCNIDGKGDTCRLGNHCR